MRNNNANMFTCLHVKMIHSRRQPVTWVLHLDVHMMICSAPVFGRLRHVSRLTALVGKLATVEVRAEVAFWAAECRWDYFFISFSGLHHRMKTTTFLCGRVLWRQILWSNLPGWDWPWTTTLPVTETHRKKKKKIGEVRLLSCRELDE